MAPAPRMPRSMEHPAAPAWRPEDHVQLWVWDVDAGHQEELLLDGIKAACDTGRTFTPRR